MYFISGPPYLLESKKVSKGNTADIAGKYLSQVLLVVGIWRTPVFFLTHAPGQYF